MEAGRVAAGRSGSAVRTEPGGGTGAGLTRTDVCIVGAGPAGLVLALLLLKSGLRVTVVEKTAGHRREFRGEILQPGALALLDRLGVLAGAKDRGCHPHQRFRLVEGDRVLLDIDYRVLPAPHNHLLSIPQAHVLDQLLVECRKLPGFALLAGWRVNGLVRDGAGRVTGVRAAGADGVRDVAARVVVAADGRFSKVRALAGIEAGRSDVFDQDVLWFKLNQGAPGEQAAGPRAERVPWAGQAVERDVRVFRASGSPVLVYHSYPDRLQIGWTLPHRSYTRIAGQGLGHVKDRLMAAVPPYADLIRDQIRTPNDLSLLDVFSGRAERWAQDGLLLIGDAAHTHGPIGAQGINLAIQDAVVAHPVLVSALAAGDTGAASLADFERRRAPDIDRVMRVQRLQSKAMLSHGTLATRVRPRLARLLRHTPLYRKVLDVIAFGNPAIRIAEECFTDGPRPRRRPGTD